MSRTSWSINALATEFQLDRRTVGKRLEGVVPVDLGPDGSPRWSMVDAAPALLNPREPRSAPTRPPPEGAEILTKIPNDVQAGFVIALLDLMTNGKPYIGGALMASGLSLEQAKRGAAHVHVALMSFADRAARNLGIPPWVQQEEPSWIPVDKIQEPDWKGLAAFAKQERAKAAPKVA
ncbi:DUF1441 family protein [Geminicoccus harenae]|uniref:DUF1441 family protein n=2 Tax=Geminicoccus harenae TaxID=2498453 RepID=UPI001C97E752|nr:DUF1441 family protein [Geminicoccus harenae]